jgi:hypothetical protein
VPGLLAAAAERRQEQHLRLVMGAPALYILPAVKHCMSTAGHVHVDAHDTMPCIQLLLPLR